MLNNSTQGLMKSGSHTQRLTAAVAAVVMAGLTPGAFADLTKADNTSALNLPASYVENAAPTGTDLLTVDGTLTAGRNAALGGDVSLKGIVVGPLAAFPLSITNTAGATLGLGTSGIDLSAAGANLTISNSLLLSGPTVFNVGAARTLTLNGGPIRGTGGLTYTGVAGSTTIISPVTPTLAVTNNLGETTLTLAAANPLLFVGQSVGGTGVGANSVITGISGNTITLSVATTAAVTGATFAGSNYSGGTTLNGGLVQLGTGTPTVISPTTGTGTGITAGTVLGGLFGTGSLTINNGTTIAATSQQNSFTAAGINIAGNITFGTAAAVARIALNGTVDMGGATRVITVNKASANVASGNEILSIGSRAATGFVPIFQNGAVDFEAGPLATAANPAVVSQVVTTNFANNNGLIIGPNVVYVANTFAGGTNAPSLTVNGAFYAGSGTISRSTTVYSLAGSGLYTNASSSTGVSVLTIAGSAGTTTFSGTITNGTASQFGSSVTAATQGLVSLAKTGASTQILTGTNTYTGPTSVTGGTLVLGAAQAIPQTTVLTIGAATGTTTATVKLGTTAQTTFDNVTLTANGKFDLGTGQLLLNNGGGATALANFTALLTTGRAGGAGFLTSSADSAHDVGFRDTGTGIYARYTLLGDADLNGAVNFNDFLVLQTNFGGAGSFANGDFNYDGQVNFNDFLALQTNFGQSVSGGAVAVSAEEVAAMTAFGNANAVPEPASLAVLGLAAAAMLRRRRA